MTATLTRGWAALALAGAVAVALLTMVSVRVPGAAPTPSSSATVALSDTAPPVEWAFTTERLGLRALAFRLAEPPPPGAALSVTITSTDAPTATLASVEVPLATASPAGDVEARFEPLWVRSSPYAPTATLLVRLGLASGEGVMLQGTTTGQEPAFTPYYEARPLDPLWPVTKMAAGRPGILGWPPLYALLAYAFLVALLRAVLVAVRAKAPVR